MKIDVAMTPGSTITTSNVKCAHFLGKTFAESLESPFRRAIRSIRSKRNPTSDRRDVDDGSLAALPYARNHGLDAAETTKEIGLHHLTKFLKRGFFHHNAAARDAGVVDENVNGSKLSDDASEGFTHGGVVIDVERDQMNWKLFFLGYSSEFRAAIQISQRRGDRMPPRARATAVASPMPLLVPVTNAKAISRLSTTHSTSA